MLGCEDQAAFPERPEVRTTEINQQRTYRASTPEGKIPTITAVCWPLPHGALAAISQVKTSAMRALEEPGVKNLRVQERAAQKGYELDVTDEKSADGIETIVSRVFYLGKTSLLEVTIAESASVAPSLIATQFLGWIDRPRLIDDLNGPSRAPLSPARLLERLTAPLLAGCKDFQMLRATPAGTAEPSA